MPESTTELSGLDLDLAIAQAVELPCPAGGVHEWRKSTATSCAKCRHMLPLFSKSIDAAWRIVEMFRTGCVGHAAAVIDLKVSDVIMQPDCYCHIYGPDIAGGEAWANSMPEAICRAALAALGSKE